MPLLLLAPPALGAASADTIFSDNFDEFNGKRATWTRLGGVDVVGPTASAHSGRFYIRCAGAGSSTLTAGSLANSFPAAGFGAIAVSFYWRKRGPAAGGRCAWRWRGESSGWTNVLLDDPSPASTTFHSWRLASVSLPQSADGEALLYLGLFHDGADDTACEFDTVSVSASPLSPSAPQASGAPPAAGPVAGPVQFAKAVVPTPGGQPPSFLPWGALAVSVGVPLLRARGGAGDRGRLGLPQPPPAAAEVRAGPGHGWWGLPLPQSPL